LPPQPSSLRQILRKQRRQISHSRQQQHSQSIIQYIIHSPLYKNSHHIALYLAADGEVDLSSMIEQLFNDNKKIFLPIILSKKNSIMHFQLFDNETPLEKNCFGILEPVYQENRCIAVEHLDLILAPLVGFDEFGNRMGMGGGYYDRALQPLIDKQIKTQFFGIAHEFQKVQHLQANHWDIPLHGIITEERMTFF